MTGPYRRRKKLTVTERKWRPGDVVQVSGTRWIIQTLKGQQVALEASSSTAKRILWSTTLDNLPAKEQTR